MTRFSIYSGLVLVGYSALDYGDPPWALLQANSSLLMGTQLSRTSVPRITTIRPAWIFLFKPKRVWLFHVRAWASWITPKSSRHLASK